MVFDANTPIYIQIAEQIRRDISAGRLHEGDQLMSTTQYAKTYRINPATAQKAFALLVDDGLVEKRRGIGMFVTAGAHTSARDEDKANYKTDTLTPAIAQAAELGFTLDDIKHMVTQLWKEATHDNDK